MDNSEALLLLDELIIKMQEATRVAVWTQAMLTFGGEATWDMVKAMSRHASDLTGMCAVVATFEDNFERIAP